MDAALYLAIMDFWVAISFLGDPRVWGIAASLLAAFYIILRVFCPDSWLEKKHHRIKVFCLVFSLSLLTTLLGVFVIKTALMIERPCVPCTEPWMSACNPYCSFSEWDTSFPSGHAATAFVFPAVLFLIFRRRWMLSLFAFSSLVAYSRIAMGVHTYQDVIAGSLLGVGLTYLFWRIRARIPVFGIR